MKKTGLAGVILAIIILFFYLDLGQYLTIDYIKAQQQQIDQFYSENRVLTIIGFFLIYILVTGASLPGAAILTLAGGAIFGLLTGLIIISFASSIGASMAFLVSRYLFRDTFQQRFSTSLKSINEGITRDGAFYLFALRLVPAFPFFVINLVMGLTPIKLKTFYWVSQVGMLAGTFVYVNAGTQLAQIDSASGILSPTLLISFVLLGLLPLIGKKIVVVLNARKALAGFKKPDHFDTNLVVIGAGSAGLVTSYIAAAVKAKVTLIERHKMGGDCLNYGCVPSKAVIRSAKFMSHVSRSKEFGIKRAEAEFDFAEVMERVAAVIKKIEPHDSIERYTSLGVDVVQGEAKITSPWSVEVNGETINARNIVVATGARPFVPPIEGIEIVDYYTSDNLWELRQKPEKLVVLGAYNIKVISSKHGSFILNANETLDYALIYSGRKIGSEETYISADYELNKRKKIINETFSDLVFESPDEIMNRAFSFAKLRAVESIFNTKGGLMHAPGGGNYYAAIWANDQAEYANPFFPFLGNLEGNESAMNSFRHFARFINADYKPIPSSIIAEGIDIWNGAGDRGDMAMIAYGATRYALAYGDEKYARELWPLIEWCLEYCRRNVNHEGVVNSDSDELEVGFLQVEQI